jgi:hypothetical protein
MMPRLSMPPLAVLIAATAVATTARGQEALSRDETARWMAVGQKCEAPLIRIPSLDGGFEIYIESPAARVAVVAAAAAMNHLSFDTERVRTALKDGYRVWISRQDSATSSIAVDDVGIRAEHQPELKPVGMRDERLTLGIAPSHGIIEAVRVRFPEFEFSAMPDHDFTIVLYTNRGIQRYRVTAHNRSGLIPICNPTRNPLDEAATLAFP